MTIHKIIFRADFARPAFAFFDKRGAVMESIHGIRENFWTGFGQSNNEQLIAAAYTAPDGTKFRQVQVEPNAVNFVYETAHGIPRGGFFRDDTVLALFECVKRTMDMLDRQSLARCGLRIFELTALESGNVPQLFGSLIDPRVTSSFGRDLPPPTDYGLTFEHSEGDGPNYLLRLGPYSAEEAPKFFDHVADNIGDTLQASGVEPNLLIDLDVFTANFLLTVAPAKWAETMFAKMRSQIDRLERAIVPEIQDVTQ